MKNLKSQFENWQAPVSESGWEALAKDAEVLAYNRKRRLLRWGLTSIPAVIVIATLIAITVGGKESTLEQPSNKQSIIKQSTHKTADNAQTTLNPVAVSNESANVEISRTVKEHQLANSEVVEVGNTPSVLEQAPTQTVPSAIPAHHESKPATKTAPTSKESLKEVAAPAPTSVEPKSVIVPQSETAITESKSNVIPEDETSTDYNLYIPNTFTPNGDGKNDIFKPLANFEVSQYEMTIFSRSGDRLFTTRNIENGWDGQRYGSQLQDGIYVYHIKYTDPDGKPQVKKGQILLIK